MSTPFLLKRLFLLILLLGILPGTVPCLAQKLRIAVAANAQFVMEEIQKRYEAQHPAKLDLIISSSGKLTAQIQNGAPFDVFLSADTHYPSALQKGGLTQGVSRIYAYGKLVIWTLDKTLALDTKLTFLKSNAVRKIALANPKLAPYGEAAVTTLQKSQLYEALQSKFVFGESIAQVNQYVTSGTATVGFTAKSVVLDPAMKDQGKWMEVDPNFYQPIAQSVALLKNARPEAAAFYSYLFTAQAQAIFRQYGYRIKEQ